MTKKIFLITGLLLLSVFLTASLFPDLLTDYDRKEYFDPWLEPSSDHLLGTDNIGCDIFTELVYGTGKTLAVGICSGLLCLAVGTAAGCLSASGGFIGTFFYGLTNIFSMFPRLVSLIVLSCFFNTSTAGLIILISVFSWTQTARNVRAAVLHIGTMDYIKACRLYGFSKPHIVLHHYIPNLSDILLSSFLTGISSCIMMESTLSFLGFSDSYYKTWGVMISTARSSGAVLRLEFAGILGPCLCIVLLSLSFYFISLYFTDVTG